MSPEVVTLIGTIAGVLVGSISTMIITLINKRSEERRHYRELVVNAAIEHWKQTVELVSKRGGRIYFLEVFMFQMMKFSEMMLDKKISEAEIIEKFTEYDSFMDRLVEYKERQTEYKKQQRETRHEEA